MKNILINLNAGTLATLSNALDHYLDHEISPQSRDWCATLNGQPSETSKLIMRTEGYQEFARERENLRLLRRQIGYQKELINKRKQK